MARGCSLQIPFRTSNLGLLFEHCLLLVFDKTNNVGLQGVNYCWFISKHQWLNIASRERIARPWRSIERSTSRNQLTANFWVQKVVSCGIYRIFRQKKKKINDHSVVMISIERNVHSAFIFEEMKSDDVTIVWTATNGKFWWVLWIVWIGITPYAKIVFIDKPVKPEMSLIVAHNFASISYANLFSESIHIV